MNKPIGKVTHYFDKAQVMIVMLENKIKIGDKIKIKRGENEFEEIIESMQIDHEPVEKGKKGEEVAIKISETTKEGAKVYHIE